MLSETWSIPHEDLSIDVSPYQLYLNDIHHPDAKKWLCQAADEEYPEARYRLGVLYENGSESLPKNTEMAYLWYRMGAEIEISWWVDSPASRSRKHWSGLAARRVEEKLTLEQRGRVESRLSGWQPGQCMWEIAN